MEVVRLGDARRSGVKLLALHSIHGCAPGKEVDAAVVDVGDVDEYVEGTHVLSGPVRKGGGDLAYADRLRAEVLYVLTKATDTSVARRLMVLFEVNPAAAVSEPLEASSQPPESVGALLGISLLELPASMDWVSEQAAKAPMSKSVKKV